jgi:alpha-tubulin suppressor-like RCC1 family protein
MGKTSIYIKVGYMKNRIKITGIGLALFLLALFSVADISFAVSPKIAAGEYHTVAIGSDGTLWAWGYNYYGQLGDGTTTDRHSPVQIGTDTNWVFVAAGSIHTVALKSDGTLWAWGYNGHGQLGDGSTTQRTSPVQMGTGTNWVAVAAGWIHTVALKSDGTLWAWGYNGCGQLGDGSTIDRYSPVQIGSGTNWVSVAAGGEYTLALKSNGTLWALGRNNYGQLGDGSTIDRYSPVQIGSGTNWVSVAAGWGHTIALKSDGTLWAWGYNGNGQLGNGTANDSHSPVQIGSGTNWVSVAARMFHTVALKSDGTLWAWGSNYYAQLGDGTATDRYSPKQEYTHSTNWVSVAAGVEHAVALKSDCTLWAWGNNYFGQLGDGTTTQRTSPIQIYTPGLCAEPTTGSVWTWGNNWDGQLGNGKYRELGVFTPEQVNGLYGIKAVAGGGSGNDVDFNEAAYSSTYVLKQDGTVWAWGANWNGQLGNGSLTESATPVQVVKCSGGGVCTGGPLTGVTAIAAGYDHVAALRSDGTIWTWGANWLNVLGRKAGSSGWSTVAIPIVETNGVTPITGFIAVAASKYYTTIALKNDGTVWAWGSNSYGELGQGGYSSSSVDPVQVRIQGGFLTDIIAISAGISHVLALKADGTVWAWGNNQYGQLGDGTTINKNLPVQVTNLSNIIAIAAGEEFSLALMAYGEVLAWGKDDKNQLGNRTTYPVVYKPLFESSPVPPLVGSVTSYMYFTDVQAIAAGAGHAAAIRKDGTVWTWGDFVWGQLSYMNDYTYATPAKQVDNALTGYYTGIACGPFHTIALKSPWNISTVDIGSDPVYQSVGQQSSIAVDSDDNMHIIYLDAKAWPNVLKYAKKAYGSNTWTFETVDTISNGMSFPSIAVSTSGTVHVSYFGSDESHWGVKYARRTSSWQTSFVSNNTNYGYDSKTSIAIDSNNRPHIVYTELNESGNPHTLKYTKCTAENGGNCTWSTPFDLNSLEGGTECYWSGEYPSIKIGSSDTVHIVYDCSNSIRYVTFNGAWSASLFNSGDLPQFLSLAVDGNNKAHISYYGVYYGRGLKYLSNPSGTWITTIIDNTTQNIGQYTSIVVDSNNRPYISYYDATNGDLMYASKNSGGSWVLATLDSTGDVGKYSSIALDSQNNAHISYFDATNGDLRYAVNGDLALPAGTVQITTPNYVAPYYYANSTSVNLNLTCSDNSGVPCEQMMISNNGIFNEALAEPFATTKTWTIQSGAGLHTITVYFKDAAGNWSVDSDQVYLDQAAPSTGTITINGGAANTNIQTVTLSLSCSDTNSGCYHMRFSDDNSTWYLEEALATETAYILPSGNGTKTVYVQFKDMAGNWSSSFSDSILLDTALPSTGSISINGGATNTSSANVSLTLTCTDPGSGCSSMQLSNDNSSWTTVAYSTSISWTLSAGDGSKTVYVKFGDAAGNWTNAYSASINLDTSGPTGSININSGALGTNSLDVTLNLTCNDSGGTGCSQMQLSNDNSNWSTLEGYSTTKSWLLAAGSNGTRTVWVRYKDALNNTSGTYNKSIIYDTDLPSVSISSPTNGAKLDTPPPIASINGTASDSLSGVQKVELQVTNGAMYLTQTGSWSGTPQWVLASGTTSWSLNTSSVVWAFDTTYTVTARATDEGSNQTSQSISFYHYGGTPLFTTLSMDLSSNTILQNGSIDVFGKLSKWTLNENIPMSGNQITITITKPLQQGQQSPEVVTLNTATYNEGYYELRDILKSGGVNIFNYAGTYTIEASYAGSVFLMPADAVTQTVLVGSFAGYAVIVEGKISGETQAELDSHNKTANRIYQTLRDRGFRSDHIYYFNYAAQTGVDDSTPTKAEVQYAIDTWPAAMMNGSPAPLYVIFVDHGYTDTFYLNIETISPTELNTWLTTLEGKLTSGALAEPKIVVIGACYSGSFIPTLSGTNRIIISSAAADEVSYKGPMEPDSIRVGEYFLEEFFKELGKGYTLKHSFAEATQKVELLTRRDSTNNTSGIYQDNAVQHPLLDDNADHTGSNVLYAGTEEDGNTSSSIYLGVGVTYDVNSPTNPAEITAVTNTKYLGSSSSIHSAMMSATTSATASAVWMEIRPPSMVLNPGSSTGQLPVNLTRVALANTGGNNWQYEYGLNCAAPEGCFNESGKYEIFYFARDAATDKISPMARSVVYKDYTANTPAEPTSFYLVSPADGSEQGTTLILDWSDSTDSDGLTYTVLISTASDFSTIYYTKEEIQSSITLIGPEANLQDLTTYYWKVQVVDAYGHIKESCTSSTDCSKAWRSFETDDTNAGNGYLTGRVSAAGSGAAIVNATISATGGSTTSLSPNGEYVVSVPAGATNVTVTASGYSAAGMTNVYVEPLQVITLNFALTPSTQNPVKKGVTTYTTLEAAFNAVTTNNEIIMIMAGTYSFGPVTYNRAYSITLKGGYNTEFTSNTGATTISGSLTIQSGCVTVENIVIQ